MHGGRPHGVFEVIPNAITSHVPPDPNPGDDMLLELSPNHDQSNWANDMYAKNADTAVPDPDASYHSTSHRKWGRYSCESTEKLPRVCVKYQRERTPSCHRPQLRRAERVQPHRETQSRPPQQRREWTQPYQHLNRKTTA